MPATSRLESPAAVESPCPTLIVVGVRGENSESRGWTEASCSGPQGNIWEGAEGLAWAEANPDFFPGYSQPCQLWETQPTQHLWPQM